MHWWDYILTVISVLCTIFSIIGAYKSVAYYKKSKQLAIYANTNLAYIESQKIIASLTEMLKLASAKRTRGTNIVKEVSKHGESIKSSINKIRECLPVEDFYEIQGILDSQQLRIEMYIDSFITGSVLVDENFVIDDNFSKCQQKFCEMQLLIKKKIENISEKLQ